MSQKNHNRPVYQLPEKQQQQQQQYFDQTLSEECHSSEEFNYEEYTTTGGGAAPAPAYPPVSLPRNIPHSMSAGQRQFQRPQTATQYSTHERRYSGSPPAAAGPPQTARYLYPNSPPQQRNVNIRAFGCRPQTAQPQRYSAADYSNLCPPEQFPPHQYASYNQYARNQPAGRPVPIHHVQQHPGQAASSPPTAPSHPPAPVPQMNRSPPATGNVPQYLRQRIALNRQQQQADSPRLATDNISAAYEETRTSTAAQQIAADYLAPSMPATYAAAEDQQQPKASSAPAATSPEAALPRATHSNTTSLSSTDSCVPQVCSAASSQLPPIFSQIIDQAVGLEKSKKMIVQLIDTAIQGLRTKGSAQSKQSLASSGGQLAGGDARAAASTATALSADHQPKASQAQLALLSRTMKRECIRKIEDELERLKQLEEFGDGSATGAEGSL